MLLAEFIVLIALNRSVKRLQTHPGSRLALILRRTALLLVVGQVFPIASQAIADVMTGSNPLEAWSVFFILSVSGSISVLVAIVWATWDLTRLT